MYPYSHVIGTEYQFMNLMDRLEGCVFPSCSNGCQLPV